VAAGACLALTSIVLLALALYAGERFAVYLFLVTAGVVACLLGLRSPVLASMYLLGTTFFRLAVPSDTFPVDPFLPAFAGALVSVWLRVRASGGLLPAAQPTEFVMALYVVWSAVSIIMPHRYPPVYPLDGTEIPLARHVLVGTVMPFAMFYVGRLVFATRSAARWLCLFSLAAAAYSSIVSIAQFHGPGWLVWPRYIAEDPNWLGRAGGVFNQPVVNGFVLVVGFAVANHLAARGRERWPIRLIAVVVGIISVYAIYLTHTRVVWLAFLLLVVCGALAAKGFRAGYVITAVGIAIAVTTSWQVLTSADRDAGGVASINEVNDRLNCIATSMHALREKPFMGWGVGRFPAVNTYEHQQWSPEVPWERGYGIASHFDVLGVAVELGVVGVLLWLTVLTLVARGLWRSVRLASQLGGDRGYALTALFAFGALMVTGLTVDLRFFDYPNILVMLWAGSAIGLSGRSDPRTVQRAPVPGSAPERSALASAAAQA
jgi:O-antigen ligase